MAPIFTPTDLLTPAVAADPYPAYRQLRDQSSVSYANRQAIGLPGRRWGLIRRKNSESGKT